MMVTPHIGVDTLLSFQERSYGKTYVTEVHWEHQLNLEKS